MMLWVCVWLGLCAVGLWALCRPNSAAQFYLKYALFFFLHLLLGVLVTVVSLVTMSFGDTNNMWWWNFFAAFMSSELLFGVRIELLSDNLSRLGVNEPCIIIINHQTALDQLVFLRCWAPGRCSILAKQSLKYTLCYGLGCMASGVHFVDRKNPGQARATSDRCVRFLTKDRGKLWIYPEGTRAKQEDTDMLPFKKGAFHMAVQAQVPIVPVVVSGYRHMYSSTEKRWHKVNIKVDVMDSVPTKGLTADDVTKLAVDVREMMLNRYHEIS